MHASRPIPIKSPRDAQVLPFRGASRTSQSLPAEVATPHFGSLKAPPDFLTGMPPLSLPMSYQENEQLRKVSVFLFFFVDENKTNRYFLSLDSSYSQRKQ